VQVQGHEILAAAGVLHLETGQRELLIFLPGHWGIAIPGPKFQLRSYQPFIVVPPLQKMIARYKKYSPAKDDCCDNFPSARIPSGHIFAGSGELDGENCLTSGQLYGDGIKPVQYFYWIGSMRTGNHTASGTAGAGKSLESKWALGLEGSWIFRRGEARDQEGNDRRHDRPPGPSLR
jgi:hypothetical protein